MVERLLLGFGVHGHGVSGPRVKQIQSLIGFTGYLSTVQIAARET